MRAKSWVPEPEPDDSTLFGRELDPFEIAARAFELATIPVTEFYDDPVGFVDEYIDFGTSVREKQPGLTPYQRETLAEVPISGRVALRGPHGLGKALHVQTVIPTPDGWSRMGELAVGDRVLDEQGKPCNVVSVSPRWQGDTWRVTFADGSELTTHGNHEWYAVNVSRRPAGVRDWREHWAATELVTTQEMAKSLRTAGGQLRWRVPTARPLTAPDAPLPIDPYTLGVWLGDGNTADGRLNLNLEDAPEIAARTNAVLADEPEGPHAIRATVPGLHRALRLGGWLGRKHIPTTYLRASEHQRRALLRGLMDTDGFQMAGGIDGVDLTCHELAADVKHLLETLGYVARLRIEEAAYTKEGDRVSVGLRWRMNFRADECPYTLRRYRDSWLARAVQASRHTQRTVVAVEQIEDAETVCITVDSSSHLFLAGSQCIPTHNTTTNALLVIWFAVTRNAAGTDWKVVTTAGAWRQLEKYLWPEIRKWVRKLRWDKLGVEPWREGREIMTLSLNLEHGEAFAVASSDKQKIEGAHADSIMYVFDESKSIAADIFDAAEGAFSGAEAPPELAPGETRAIEGRDLEAFAVATSTPGEPNGRFYDIHSRKPGFEDWKVRHVTVNEVIAAGRISEQWRAQREKQWGAESALYHNRVLGEFWSSAADSTIPLSWVEAAVERWHEWANSGRRKHAATRVVGVDVARGGADNTVIAYRRGVVIEKVDKLSVASTTAVTAAVQVRVEGGDEIVVDAVGVGGGVLDQLAQAGYQVRPFTASRRSYRTDVSGQLGFLNRRAELWWGLRERLDPAANPTICLPPDDGLIAELTSPKWSITAGGKIQVEGKEDLRKRLGRSTDTADAVLHTWASPESAEGGDGSAGVVHSYGGSVDLGSYLPGHLHTANSGAFAFGDGEAESFHSWEQELNG